LDASGFSFDQTRPFVYYSPGGRGTSIDPSSVVFTPTVERGDARILSQYANENSCGFTLFAQAAGGFPFGHHSGRITCDVYFQWYDNDQPMDADAVRERSKAAREQAVQDEYDAAARDVAG